jgi:hypothetical protein
MVNITYTEASSDMIYTPDDGSDPVLYNAGDMAFSGSPSFPHRRLSALTSVIAMTALVWIMVPGVGESDVKLISFAPFSRARPVLLWSFAPQKRLVHDLPLHGRYRGRLVPVVLLGLLARLLGRRLGVHRRPEVLLPQGCSRRPLYRLEPNPRPPVLRLPMHVRCESRGATSYTQAAADS